MRIVAFGLTPKIYQSVLWNQISVLSLSVFEPFYIKCYRPCFLSCKDFYFPLLERCLKNMWIFPFIHQPVSHVLERIFTMILIIDSFFGFSGTLEILKKMHDASDADTNSFAIFLKLSFILFIFDVIILIQFRNFVFSTE